MARAYITLARNDLDENLLQVLDLKPNSSQRVPSLTPEGQTGYLTYLPQHDTIITTAPAGVITTSAAYYGLAAYLWDNVNDADNANIHLTAARANAISAALLAAVGLGTALTTTEVDAAIHAATGGGASHLASANSIGTIEDLMRILSGEVYYLPSGSTSGAAAAFTNPHYRSGRFLEANAIGQVSCVGVNNNDTVTIAGVVFTAKTAGQDIPNLYFLRGGASNAIDASSLMDVINDHRTQAKIKARNNGLTVTARTERGNRVVLTASVPGTTGELSLASSNATRLPVQAMDWVSGAYRPFRKIMDVGQLHASALNGALSKLKAATFAWTNPAFTYGSAGTAFKANGTTHIATTGVGAAITVYDASGNVI
jgi:hypothetical protein